MHFEEEEANASWIYGKKSGIVGCRRLEGSPWIFHRVPAKPLVGSLLVQDICGRNLLSDFVSLLEKKGGKRFGNSFPPHCSGLKNPGEFLAEGEEDLWNSGSLVCEEPQAGRGRLEVWKGKPQN